MFSSKKKISKSDTNLTSISSAIVLTERLSGSSNSTLILSYSSVNSFTFHDLIPMLSGSVSSAGIILILITGSMFHSSCCIILDISLSVTLIPS